MRILDSGQELRKDAGCKCADLRDGLKWWDCWTSVDFRSKLEISTAMRGPVLLGASLERRCGETMSKIYVMQENGDLWEGLWAETQSLRSGWSFELL